MKKNHIFVVFLMSFIIMFSGCMSQNEKKVEKSQAKIQFVDDSGRIIRMNEPAKRIISLYSAHTENLFALGLEEEIIGVGKSDAYPHKVKEKMIYDYRSDPEKIIAAEPDLVLIRPFILSSKPEFVEAIERVGITVVSLYPDKYEEFTPYINKLALLTGTEERATKLLDKFNEDIDSIKKMVEGIEPKVKVYFESTKTNYRTITPDSMAAHAIEFAGGLNIASDAVPLKAGTSIASYGAERILKKAEDIDVFVAQKGAMNSGGNFHDISTRSGFKAIKAVRNGRIYNINEKLVSSPTFRFAKGVKELARMFYPNELDDLQKYNNNDFITRADMAKMTVLFKHKGIFAPTSSYYSKKHLNHKYGEFIDVDISSADFDYVETAVLAGYMEGKGEKFHPQQSLKREELAKILYMLVDLEEGNKVTIKDIEKCENQRIIEIIVGNGILELEKHSFNPQRKVTGQEVLKALEIKKK